jgi:hypothetical protein
VVRGLSAYHADLEQHEWMILQYAYILTLCQVYIKLPWGKVRYCVVKTMNDFGLSWILINWATISFWKTTQKYVPNKNCRFMCKWIDCTYHARVFTTSSVWKTVGYIWIWDVYGSELNSLDQSNWNSFRSLELLNADILVHINTGIPHLALLIGTRKSEH